MLNEFHTIRRWAAAFAVAGLGLAGAASAAFIDQGGGVILDDVTNLEWEQNANHGSFNWTGAVSYANTLALDGGGWHLASIGELDDLYDNLITAVVCTGVNCTGNRGLFTGIQSEYWSGTEVSPGSIGWYFNFEFGFPGGNFEDFSYFAWAVRPGDVDDARVPAPSSLVLLGLGLAGLGWSRRKK